MTLSSPSRSNADPKLQASPIISRNTLHIPEDQSHNYKDVSISRALRCTPKSSSRRHNLETICSSSDSTTTFTPIIYTSPNESSKGNMLTLAHQQEDSVGASPGKVPRRPPNGFLNFRSEFLRNGLVPKAVEKRQQVLSQVAGHAWNALSNLERQRWLDDAKFAKEEYKRSNPVDCQTLAPRTPRARKSKGKETREDTEKKVDEIRKLYLNLHGPAPLSPRKKKEKERKARRRHSSPITRHQDTSDGALQAAFEHSSAPSSPQKSEETDQPRYISHPDTIGAPQERLGTPPHRPSTPPPFMGSGQIGPRQFYLSGGQPYYEMQAFTLSNVPQTPTRNTSYSSQPFTPRSSSISFSTPVPRPDSLSPSTPQRHNMVNGAQMIPNMYGSYDAVTVFNPQESPTTTVMRSHYKIPSLGLGELDPSRTSVPFLDPASLQPEDPSLGSDLKWSDSPHHAQALNSWLSTGHHAEPDSPCQVRRQHRLSHYGTNEYRQIS